MVNKFEQHSVLDAGLGGRRINKLCTHLKTVLKQKFRPKQA